MIRHPKEDPGPLVTFDFDGTLTCRDSFVAFLAWRAGHVGFAVGLLALLPAVVAWIGHRDRGVLTAAMVRRFLRGEASEPVATDAASFQDEAFSRLMRPDALACWRDWQAKGARLYIVTASPELVIAPFAAALGADGLIGTRLAADPCGRLTGELEGLNCRGPEKVRRIRERFGDGVVLAAAYGDTSGDREMLAEAGIAGFKVFTTRP